MRKGFSCLLAVLLSIFSFSCSFSLLENLNGGKLSFKLLDTQYSKVASIPDEELPKEYKIKITSAKGNFKKEGTYPPYSTVVIDHLPIGEVEVNVEGIGLHYGFYGKTNVTVVEKETTPANIDLKKYFLPVYVKPDALVEGDGSASKPFKTMNKAIGTINDFGGGIGTVYLDGIISQFFTPCDHITLTRAPGASKAELNISNFPIENGTLEILDIDCKGTNFKVSNTGSGVLKIGGNINLSSSTVNLDPGQLLVISKPLSQTSSAKISITDKHNSTPVLHTDNPSVNLGAEGKKFKIEGNTNNQFYISNSGTLAENKQLSLKITNYELGVTYNVKVKDKNEDSYVITTCSITPDGSATTILKDMTTYFFNIGTKYVVELYKPSATIPITTSEITISNGENNLEIQAREPISATKAKELMTATPTGTHNLLVSITNEADFATLKAGLNALTTGKASIELAGSITTIPTEALKNCIGLQKIVLPNNITKLDTYAFSGCTNLESINLNNITTINTSAFEGCSKLSSIGSISTLTSLGTYAFKGCSSLTSISLPYLYALGEGTFNGCTSLNSVTLTSGLTSIGAGAFNGCTSLTELVIPNTVTSVANLSNTSITTLTAPCTLDFRGNINLTNVTITKDVNNNSYIGARYYNNCINLATLDISEINSFSGDTFEGCNSITSVTFGSPNEWIYEYIEDAPGAIPFETDPAPLDETLINNPKDKQGGSIPNTGTYRRKLN